MARGSVKRRGSAYSIVYDGPTGPDGQRRQRRESGFRTKREAQERLTAALREVDTGTSLEPSTLTVAAYLRHWLATLIAPHKRPLTVYRYTLVANNHVGPHLGALLLTKLTPAQVAKWHATLQASGLSPTSVAGTHAVLSTALRQAVRWQLIARNPCDLAPFAQPERTELPVWDTEIASRFQAAVADDPDAVLWLLAIATGMRRGELLGLKWADVDFERAVLRVRRQRTRDPQAGGMAEQGTKGKRARVLDLSPRQVAMLRAHRVRQVELRLQHADDWHDEDWVFVELPGRRRSVHLPGGRAVSPGSFFRRWRRILAATGLPPIRPHDLRHTNATVLLEQGVHPKVVQERLGHARFSETYDRYSHVTPSLGREAALTLDAALAGEKRRS